MERMITPLMLAEYELYLNSDEKSANTISKYMRDVRRFADYCAQSGKGVDKAVTLAYKESLAHSHAISSANSMLAATNSFLRFVGWEDACVKQYKLQRNAYCGEEKELSKAEYVRLVNAARSKGNERLSLILQTICSTGIRVSELRFITVEAVRNSKATVYCKGKIRIIFIVKELRRLLLQYAKRKGIRSGSVFVTQNGNPMGRSCIWKEMKLLSDAAQVMPEKVFPHNLRHLFARTFYCMERDIAKLADILGHTSINTTRIYLTETGAEHRRKMENLRLVLRI